MCSNWFVVTDMLDCWQCLRVEEEESFGRLNPSFRNPVDTILICLGEMRNAGDISVSPNCFC